MRPSRRGKSTKWTREVPGVKQGHTCVSLSILELPPTIEYPFGWVCQICINFEHLVSDEDRSIWFGRQNVTCLSYLHSVGP